MKTRTVIYVGESFVTESDGVMSSLYLETGGRYNHARLAEDVKAGVTVTIRPPSASELEFYEECLHRTIRTIRSACKPKLVLQPA